MGFGGGGVALGKGAERLSRESFPLLRGDLCLLRPSSVRHRDGFNNPESEKRDEKPIPVRLWQDLKLYPGSLRPFRRERGAPGEGTRLFRAPGSLSKSLRPRRARSWHFMLSEKASPGSSRGTRSLRRACWSSGGRGEWRPQPFIGARTIIPSMTPGRGIGGENKETPELN